MDKYWHELIANLGRKVMFIDTGAILSTFDPGDDRFRNFFKSAVGYRFVTSTYVVAETVRRLVKAGVKSQFCGPNGERTLALSRHILKVWLEERNVFTICIPETVFEATKVKYCTRHGVDCDLTDLLSADIVRGLEQKEILSPDSHFQQLGLQCLP